MSQELVGSIVIIVAVIAVVIIIIIYSVRRIARAGQVMFDDPQMQDLLRKEQALERDGEWRAEPEAGLVLGDFDISSVGGNWSVNGADVIVAPRPQSLIVSGLAPIAQFVGQELAWELQYQNSKGCRRADLQPVGGGPTLAILELTEPELGGALAQFDQQGYIIYPPKAWVNQSDQATNDIPPDVAIFNGLHLVFGDGRRYDWRPAITLHDPSSFTDKDGKTMILFHHNFVRIIPTASPAIVPALVLIEYYLYIRPVGD